MKYLVLAAALAAAAPLGAQAQDPGAGYADAPPLPRTVRAVDGDTLAGLGTRIRLAAIDAPEMNQTCTMGGAPYACGVTARATLQGLLDAASRAGWSVSCQPETTDRYGRTVATCTTSEGHDLGGAMVRLGWAIPYYQYGGARYAGPYALALRDRVGMHQGTFVDPASWRHAGGH